MAEQTTQTTQMTLYERLGGEAGVAVLIDRFYAKVLADPELSPVFAGAAMDHVRRMQREFVATALGGPTRYGGQSLRRAHDGKGITTRHFYLFARKLLESLDEMGLPRDDVYAVVDRIAVNANDVTGEAAFVG